MCWTASCKTLHEGSIRPCPTLDEHTILARSYWLPGSYMTSNSMSAGCDALPRFLVLCTSGCIALLFAQICRETGKEHMVKVHSGEGLANHSGPDSGVQLDAIQYPA